MIEIPKLEYKGARPIKHKGKFTPEKFKDNSLVEAFIRGKKIPG